MCNSNSYTVKFILGVLVLLFLCGSSSLQAQLVRFVVEVEGKPSRIEADPINFNSTTDDNAMKDANGNISGMQTVGCITIVSKENTSVIVDANFSEIMRSYDNKTKVEIETRYINDGGECPTSPDMVKQVGGVFERGRATFPLHKAAKSIRNMPEMKGEVKSYITFLGLQKFEKSLSEEEMLQVTEQEYEGIFTIEIEYI